MAYAISSLAKKFHSSTSSMNSFFSIEKNIFKNHEYIFIESGFVYLQYKAILYLTFIAITTSFPKLFPLKNKKLATKQIILLYLLHSHWDLSTKRWDTGRDLKVNFQPTAVVKGDEFSFQTPEFDIIHG